MYLVPLNWGHRISRVYDESIALRGHEVRGRRINVSGCISVLYTGPASASGAAFPVLAAWVVQLKVF